MSTPQRFLIRVLVFLVLAVGVALALSSVIVGAFGQNPLLNGLILAVLLLGIVYNIRRITQLRPEMRWIDAYRTVAPGFSIEDPPRLLAPVAAVLSERDRRGRGALSAVSLRYLLDSLDARLGESRDLARYLTGLLIFLGLLGTFWGLLQAINAVGAVIADLSVGGGDFVTLFNQMKAGLSRPLGGMGTAFSSSLFGLAGSLVLGFLDLQASQAQNSFYNDLEEWLSSIARHELIEGASAPALAQTAGPPLPGLVQAMLQQTAENLDRLQGTVARSEDERLLLLRALGTLNERLAGLGDRLDRDRDAVRALVDRHQELADAVGTIARASGELTLDPATREHIRNADARLAQLIEAQERGREELLRELRSDIRLVARTIAVASGEPRAFER